jgi:conjugative transposon TraK protein
MFQQLKNIDSAFKHIKLFTIVLIASCTITRVFEVYEGYKQREQSEQRLYLLEANGRIRTATASSRMENIPVEARDHIKMFHFYFFSLDPDDEVIKDHIGKALYLADASAQREYDNLRESGYYANIISGNVSQRITPDSIIVHTDTYPYHFRYYGKEKIIRTTTIVTRSLITEGYLRNVNRSDNNPHGFLIERWRILENKDLSVSTRRTGDNY